MVDLGKDLGKREWKERGGKEEKDKLIFSSQECVSPPRYICHKIRGDVYLNLVAIESKITDLYVLMHEATYTIGIPIITDLPMS